MAGKQDKELSDAEAQEIIGRVLAMLDQAIKKKVKNLQAERLAAMAGPRRR